MFITKHITGLVQLQKIHNLIRRISYMFINFHSSHVTQGKNKIIFYNTPVEVPLTNYF